MGKNLVENIAAWSEGDIDDEALLARLEPACEDLAEHGMSFESIVEGFTPEQREACGELVDFASLMLENLETQLQEIEVGITEGDRETIFCAGDEIARATFQLNQALTALRHQAFMVLGPTEIPSLNELISLKDEFLADPCEENKTLFQEGIDSERIVSYHGWEDLGKEPALTEVSSLMQAFKNHMSQLNSLAEALSESGEEADFDAHFSALTLSFREVASLVPQVEHALATQGETDIPDINFLLTLMKEVSAGNIGDGPLLEALEACEIQAEGARKNFEAMIGTLDSVLAREELEAAVDCFDILDEGLEAAYNFLEERDRLWLVEADGQLVDFAAQFAAHDKRLQEIMEQQGKVTCPRCSTLNETSKARCAQCGFQLPQNIAAKEISTFQAHEGGGLEGEQEPLLVTAYLEKLYLAINGFDAGTIDEEALLSEVDKFEQRIDANAAKLPTKLEEPASEGEENETAQNLLEELHGVVEQGILLMKEGLESVRDYPRAGDPILLKEAILSIDAGAKKVAAAADAALGQAPSEAAVGP